MKSRWDGDSYIIKVKARGQYQLIDETKIKKAVKLLIEAIGEDPKRQGIVDTPRRIAEMYSELFAGIGKDPGKNNCGI